MLIFWREIATIVIMTVDIITLMIPIATAPKEEREALTISNKIMQNEQMDTHVTIFALTRTNPINITDKIAANKEHPTMVLQLNINY